jgi:hypothetical protein
MATPLNHLNPIEGRVNAAEWNIQNGHAPSGLAKVAPKWNLADDPIIGGTIEVIRSRLELNEVVKTMSGRRETSIERRPG